MYTVLGGAIGAGGLDLVLSQLAYHLVDPNLKGKVSRSLVLGRGSERPEKFCSFQLA